MIALLSGVLMASLAASPADVKGTWEGKVTAQREDGTTHEDTALLVLDQKDGTITGTIGGHEADQHPITTGTIEGNKVTIVARHSENNREFRLELLLENDEMKGTVISGERRGSVEAKRRQK